MSTQHPTLLSKAVAQLSERRDSLLYLCIITAAYGFDYLFSVVTGRLLGPSQFSIIVALAALGQIFVLVSRVIQTVTIRYVTNLRSGDDAGMLPAFFRAALRSTIIGGGAITLLLLLFTIPIANFLRIDETAPVAALLLAVWLMVFRPVVGGTLLGQQRFVEMGVVQLVQAVARVLLGAALVLLGYGVFGAMLALPIASLLAFFYGLYALRELRGRKPSGRHGIQFAEFFRYASVATLGLVGYAVLVNMDAILVKRFFSAETAGLYASAITLGKVVQFFPVAIIMVLFPKATERQATNRDPAAVLPPAVGLITLVCVGVAILYFLFADLLIPLMFGSAFALDGPVLGLIAIAMWLLSLSNVWLYYFLSINKTAYVGVLWVGVVAQAAAFTIWHDALWQLPTSMAVVGGALTLLGWLLFLWQRRSKSG